jgi:hypothetical protein
MDSFENLTEWTYHMYINLRKDCEESVGASDALLYLTTCAPHKRQREVGKGMCTGN